MLRKLLFPLFATLSLVAIVMAPAGVRAPAALAKGEDVTSTWLYQLEPHYGRILLPLNPMTLADMPDMTGPILGSIRPPDPSAWLLASADGKTVASVSYRGGAAQDTRARDITVRVFDVATGIERAHVHPQVPLAADGLSPDGSLLYGERLAPAGRGTAQYNVWYEISTSTGRTLDTVKLRDVTTWLAAYDFASHRLYALDVLPYDTQTHRPQTPSILAYDVPSGRQVGVLPLTGVLAGGGQTGRTVNGQPVYAQWFPGFALSPDGHHLAVLDGNTDTLRLIDASSLTVISTEELTQPASLLDQVAGWLGILPSVALAKGGEGISLSMTFSPDGLRLYVTGRKGTVDSSGQETEQDLGLLVVDVTSGRIMAQTQQEAPLGFSPDGSALYTLTAPAQGNAYVLRRDDPVTLKVLAQRTFNTYPDLLLLPAG